MIFCPLKILLNSAILQYKKNRQEFIRIFQKRKSIKKGFKINIGSGLQATKTAHNMLFFIKSVGI